MTDHEEIAELRAKLAAAEKERDDWKIAFLIQDEMGSRLVEERDALAAEIAKADK